MHRSPAVGAWLRRFDAAAILTAIILIECAVLALNRGRGPLTDIDQRGRSLRSPGLTQRRHLSPRPTGKTQQNTLRNAFRGQRTHHPLAMA